MLAMYAILIKKKKKCNWALKWLWYIKQKRDSSFKIDISLVYDSPLQAAATFSNSWNHSEVSWWKRISHPASPWIQRKKKKAQVLWPKCVKYSTLSFVKRQLRPCFWQKYQLGGKLQYALFCLNIKTRSCYPSSLRVLFVLFSQSGEKNTFALSFN